jgi:hypothetical protein
MGTGIVSIALAIDGAETLSRVLLAIAAAAWVVLGAALASRAASDRPSLRLDARLPGSLTAVAGTAVLGARVALLGWGHVAAVLLALSIVTWIALVVPVLRNLARPSAGAAFMLAVSTESIAALAAFVATVDSTRWLLAASVVPLVLGIAAYLLVVVRFDRHELLAGRGDHWVAGGALAIATLACAKIGAAGELTRLLRPAALVLWIAAAAWVPVLVATEVSRPRGYHLHRWATVFPVGMYAVCSFLVAGLLHVGPIADFARVCVWISVAVWGVVVVGMARDYHRRR